MSRVPSYVDLMNHKSGAETVREVGETLAGRIRTGLSDDITSGRIAPGAEIDEQDLAQRFGASRTPVREALRELASAGLVIIEPRRGARVVEMTAERVGELFELMAEIEAVCVRFATYRCNAVERASISRIHAAALQAVEASDVDGYDQLNPRISRRPLCGHPQRGTGGPCPGLAPTRGTLSARAIFAALSGCPAPG